MIIISQVTEDYKKKRLKNMRKRREYLDSNYIKSDLLKQANKNRLFIESSHNKHTIVNFILMREFGSYRMGNNKLNPKKVIFPKKIEPKPKMKKKKYQVKSMRKYGISKQFDTKKDAVNYINKNLRKGIGNTWELNGLNSNKKYQNLEDHIYNPNKRKKITIWVSRKLNDLD